MNTSTNISRGFCSPFNAGALVLLSFCLALLAFLTSKVPADDRSLPREISEQEANERDTRKTEQALDKVVPRIDVKEMTFESAIEVLRNKSGVNLIPNWSALEAQAIEKDSDADLILENTTIRRALTQLLENVGGGEVELGFEVDGTIVRISTKEDLSRHRQTVVYDVTDLVLGGAGAAGPDDASEAQPDGNAGAKEPEDAEDNLGEVTPKSISAMIMNVVDPESWQAAGGNVGSITIHQNSLVITLSRSAHSEIRRLLQTIRLHGRVSFSVDVAVLRIERSYEDEWRSAAARFPVLSGADFTALAAEHRRILINGRLSGAVRGGDKLEWTMPWSDGGATVQAASQDRRLNVSVWPALNRLDQSLVVRAAITVGKADGASPSTGRRIPEDRGISTTVTLKRGEGVALQLPPDQVGLMESRSEWVLIYPRLSDE